MANTSKTNKKTYIIIEDMAVAAFAVAVLVLAYFYDFGGYKGKSSVLRSLNINPQVNLEQP